VVRGRAARAEFWWWVLWSSIITQVAQIPWVIGVLTVRPEQPSPSEAAALDRATASFDPFPVWGYLLASLPPVAKVGLGLVTLVLVVTAVPWIAIAARRLHDTDRSAWWLLLYAVPIGNAALVVLLASPSDERGARFDDGAGGGDRSQPGPGGPRRVGGSGATVGG
jgi:uncharacterized membrane protein YhaH (DUF805 family)